MKLRLHENTLRFRLSRVDLAKLAETGSVEETVAFAPDRNLIYRIESGPAPEVSASFDGACISVSVPASAVERWAATDQTGIEASAGTLNILMEKDFRCLHHDAPEDDGAFPNPARNRTHSEA